MRTREIALGLLAVGAAAAAATLAPPRGVSASNFADADDPALTARGSHLYVMQCAKCHGRRLEGQALWQLRDEYRYRRAPALDFTGRSWRRSDDELFRIVKSGRVPETPSDVKSHMPAFQDRLEEGELLAVVAYVKASWPAGLRALQATRNPGGEGMPKDANSADWRLPANCVSGEGEGRTGRTLTMADAAFARL